jgi:hypothetical protein
VPHRKNFVVVCQHNLISVPVLITPICTGNCEETMLLLWNKFLTPNSSLTTQTPLVNTSVDLAANFLTSDDTEVYKKLFLFKSHSQISHKAIGTLPKDGHVMP